MDAKGLGRAPLSDLKLDGEQDPHGDGVMTSSRGLEAPAADGVDGRLVEIGVTGGLLNEDVAHAAVDEDVDFQHGRSLNALT